MKICSHEQPPSDGSVVNDDENGGTKTSVATNDEDGGREPNNNMEERSGDNDSSTASDKVEVDSQLCKFFAEIGLYDGTVEKITKTTPTDTEYEIKFTDGKIEIWSQESFTQYQLEASITIGTKGWQFAEKFTGTKGDIYCSGKGEYICMQGKNKNKCWCKYVDGYKKYKTLAQLQKLTKNQFDQTENEAYIYYTEDKEEEEEEDRYRWHVGLINEKTLLESANQIGNRTIERQRCCQAS
eukprot:13089312-Ditylum_brightwellii.AAC.1